MTHQLCAGVGDTSVPHGKGWEDAKGMQCKDPRFVPLGPVWLPDADRENLPKECVGRMQIDPTFSGLQRDREHAVVQEIGRKFFLGPKQPDIIPPNIDGKRVRLVLAELLIRPSSDATKQVLNLIGALAQSGKASEIAWAMWAISHVIGVFPKLELRRSGGRIDAATAKKDIDAMNASIRDFLETLRFNKDEAGHAGQGPYGRTYAWLAEDAANEYERYVIDPKIVTESAVEVEVQHAPWTGLASSEYVVGLVRPTCVISLMTAPSMNKMHKEGIFKASDKKMQSAAKSFSFYQLMGGSHNHVPGKEGIIVHSKYPSKCHDPYRSAARDPKPLPSLTVWE